MAKVLSKYSRTNSLVVDYASQQDYMNSLSLSASVQPEDYRTPYTYKEWLNRNVGLISGLEYKQYNDYLKNWYANRYTTVNSVVNLKENYIALLQELSLAFKDDNEFVQFSNIDFANDLEIEDAIPIFSRKLKEIAIYFINKRDAVKKAKLKYNMSGARNALEKLFYEYLLKAFTQRDYVLNVPEQSAYDTFPELSAVKDGFQIIIQELYDNTSYMDKDPIIPVSAYYDLTNPVVTAYFDSLNFDSSNLEWLFGTGVETLCADNPLIWMFSDMVSSLSAFETPEMKLLNDYNRINQTKKYLGNEIYYVSGGYYILKTDNFEYDLNRGNSWFYWPSGEYYMEANNSIIYDPIMLTATNLIDSGAIGSSNYKNSDKIFVLSLNTGDLSGAWLKTAYQTINRQVMSAYIDKNISDGFNFKFPFPGYGVVGEGIDWNGPQLDNIDVTYNYLEEDTQREIQSLYWNLSDQTSAFNPININDTQLVDNGAYASITFDEADKISVRITQNPDNVHDITPGAVYNSLFNHSWLYKFIKTDLPVKVGQTYINWPIQSYDPYTLTTFNILTSQCKPVNVNDIDARKDLIGSRAGYGLFDSDIIYKLDGPNGYPVECAFLSGYDIKDLATPSTTLMYNATGKIQPSFTLRVRPGNAEPFVWHDTSTYIDQTTLVNKQHQSDCLYTQKQHSSILKTRGKTLDQLGMTTNGIGDWNECTCRAVKYNPIGHPGSLYSDYGGMADAIFVDHQFPNTFDKTTWRDSSNNDYTTSPDFAYWCLSGNNPYETDIGWGNGYWKTGNGSRFQLKPGILYKYYRSNLMRNSGDLLQYAVPDLIVKQKYNSVAKPTWMKATLDSQGLWNKTVSSSDMVLNPSDYILYDHVDSNWYCLTSIGTVGTATTQRTTALNINNSQWTSLNYVTTGFTIGIAWPYKFYQGGPNHISMDLDTVRWEITKPDASKYYIEEMDAETIAYFDVQQAGTYSLSVTGIGSFGREVYSAIAPVTGLLPTYVTSVTGNVAINTLYNDRINFTINTQLSGWNYNTKSYDGVSIGGRPFWAKSYDDDGSQTKYKGINIWGGGIRVGDIDDYTFITQPNVATLYLSSGDTVKFEKKNDAILWTEPIDFIIDVEDKRWCKLNINKNVTSPLSSYLYSLSTELIVSATDLTSDITLTQTDNQFVNYWSASGLTWSQVLTSSIFGIPPSGGVWVAETTGLLVDPYVPYANLTNRHYPTIATMPYVGNLYSDEDSGGYFVPKMLGATTFLAKNYDNKISLSNISNIPSERGNDSLYKDPNYYKSDYGLSNTDQIAPVSTIDIDARWMKSSVTTYGKAGMIVNAKSYQEFLPYQTKYESTNINQYGMRTQNDEYTPWYGDYDNIWRDAKLFPANFREEYPITDWYASNAIPEDTLYHWKVDIFGNQYFLLKDKNITGLYNKKITTGDMWVRNVDGRVSPASAMLSAFYQDCNVLTTPSVSLTGKFKSFDLWYDTLMIQTSSSIVINKIIYDYNTSNIDSLAYNIKTIGLNDNHLAGTWLFEEPKKVAICTLVSADYGSGIYYPEVYLLDLNTFELDKQYTGYNNSDINQMSSLQLTSIEAPVFTYNYTQKMYNLAFLGYGLVYGDMVLNTINIKNLDSTCEIDSIYCITPT